nr:immunoglobulin heavy chain junction region [Macaca mulatta]MOW49018.1 immunoglobulin heavy chain junction region [Macaca mulatta]
CRVGSTMFDIW